MEKMEEGPIQNKTVAKRLNEFKSMKHKNDTEALRKMLREKCRIRIKETRQHNFDITRNFLESEKLWLAELLKNELLEFEENVLLEDAIWQELIEESYNWMVEQYEREVNYYASTESVVPTLCPICQISELVLNNQELICKCGFRLGYKGSLNDFRYKIGQTVAVHEEKCTGTLTFFTEPIASGKWAVLNAICKACDYFAEVA